MKRALLIACATLAACGGEEEKTESTCVPGAGAVCTVMGTSVAGYRAGKPLKSRLYLPQDVLFGPDGRMYVSDWNNHRIRAVQLPDGTVADVAGSGLLGDGFSEPALDAELNHPTGMAFDGLGRLLIAAWHNSKVKRVDLTTGELTDTCGTGKRAYSGDEGPAAKADLDLPASIAFHDGNLYILDQANQVIRMVDGADNIHLVAGKCVTVGACQDGESPVACPGGSGKHACASTEGACGMPCKPAFAAGPASEMRMNQPFGQAAIPAGRLGFGPDGHLYFADTGNHLIRRIDLTSGEVVTVAGKVKEDATGGVRGNAPDGAPAAGAELDTPIDLEIAPDGTIYFTDMGNSCIRAVRPDGTLSIVAGVCGDPGYDGEGKPPRETRFDQPFGLTLHDGSLYVADTHNHRIRRVVLP